MTHAPYPAICWQEATVRRPARWRSEAGLPPPVAVDLADDRISAEAVWRAMEAGTALLWCGDWANAGHLLQALTRRADRRFAERSGKPPTTAAEAFARHRERQGRRAALLARLLVPVGGDYTVQLRRGVPAKLKQLQNIFYLEAAKYNVLPLDNTTLARWNAPKPSLTAGRTEFTYSGTLANVPGSTAPHILNKSYKTTAEVTIPAGGGEGMIVTQGGRFGGYGLFLSNGELGIGRGKVVFLYTADYRSRFLHRQRPQTLQNGRWTV